MCIPAVALLSLLMLQPPRAYSYFLATYWLAGPCPDMFVTDVGFVWDYPIVSAAQVWGHSWTGSTRFHHGQPGYLWDLRLGRSSSLLIMASNRRLFWLSLQVKFQLLHRFVSWHTEWSCWHLTSCFSYPLFSSRSQMPGPSRPHSSCFTMDQSLAGLLR